ncbi:MAG: ribosomal RNA small subunit methyltransferase A [Planctomycetota bacterium]|nr:MAG: ribosomal RNA small subunit methyltransferase A [Planctomycetota bacterium]
MRLNTRHGQNFLIEGNLLRLLVDRAALDQRDVVFEVGTGTGALTDLMAPLAGAVVSVEIDHQLHQLAREELIAHPNVTLLRADALKNKSNLNPDVVAEVERQLAVHDARRLKLVANLPYNVATPVIANLLSSTIVPAAMTVTVQKEVADRMVATPGSKDYGALSVWIQCQCRTEIVRTLAPSVFWPRPKVTSAIIHLEVDRPRRDAIADLAFFHDFVRSMFLHRRKFLRGVMLSTYSGRLDKPQVDEILAALDLRGEIRAEQLDVPAFLRLAAAVQSALPPE